MKIDWVNTPGGYYAIAYFISCVMMIMNGPQKLGRRKRNVILGIYGILLYSLMTITHGSPQWMFIPYMLLFLVMMWVTIQFCCQYDVFTALYFTARSFIIGEFIASLEWEVFYYCIFYEVIPNNMLSNILLLVAVDGSLIILLYKLEHKNKEVNNSIQINRRELLSATIITVAIFTVSNISYVFENVTMSEMVIQQLFMVRTLVDLGGVAILYAYHIQLGDLNMRYEMERLQGILEMQHHNYEMLEQSVNAINQKYHDLKYQINILKTEVSSENSIAYLDQMEREIKAYEAQNKIGNKILDTILTGKSLYCQSNWIELTNVVDGEALGFMDPMDICTLFGNMIDNAIESVMKIDRKEQRLIHLIVAKKKGFLRIRMENCYVVEPKLEKGILITSKKDKKYHGYGMKSIQSTVKKYGGSTTFSSDNGWFELRILIPLKTIENR